MNDENLKPKQHGGKRPGAGRKSEKVKALVAQATADDAVADLDELRRMAYDDKVGEKTRAAILMYRVDRVLGKPVAKVEGDVTHLVLLIDDLK